MKTLVQKTVISGWGGGRSMGKFKYNEAYGIMWGKSDKVIKMFA